ncbi:MAG TPA: hypothetical protein P5121_31550 [Caldilineaceae bacterium]|nr:hypothetical protein [Caldilineaceae bacterium]
MFPLPNLIVNVHQPPLLEKAPQRVLLIRPASLCKIIAGTARVWWIASSIIELVTINDLSKEDTVVGIHEQFEDHIAPHS